MRISDWSSDVFSSDLYQPLPRDIAVWDNGHGKAGFAPAFPGGAEIAAAMGGSIPPVLWDGAGNAIVNDDVGVLSLNLPDVSTPQSEAKPSPADLKGEAPAPLPGITLPASLAEIGSGSCRERVCQDV